MKVVFKTTELENFYITPLDKLEGKLPFQKDVIKQFKKKMEILIGVDSLDELRQFKSLNFEPLKPGRYGFVEEYHETEAAAQGAIIAE